MEKAGEGIANQRKAIAVGIKDSLESIQETGVSNNEANLLFYVHAVDRDDDPSSRAPGKSSTVVLPSNFKESASMFEQMVAAAETNDAGNVPPTPVKKD